MDIHGLLINLCEEWLVNTRFYKLYNEMCFDPNPARTTPRVIREGFNSLYY